MLVFIDESGDTGRKIFRGSSKFFIVLFEDHEEAVSCDRKIDSLRRELKLSESFEFHFAQNSKKVRTEFLKAVQSYHFIYFSVVIDKDPEKMLEPEFTTKDSFYNYACHMAFNNAKPYLAEAIIVIDETGSPDFKNKLAKFLRRRLNNDDKKVIKEVKQQRSSSNNLLQLADYVSGVINRKVQDKKDSEEFYRFLSSKEICVQILPK